MTDQVEAGDGEPVLTLQQVIRGRMDERGWSYSDLARRSGDRLNRNRWQQFGTGRRLTRFPEPANIVLMAEVLEVDVTTVLHAVAQSLGINARRRGPDLAHLLPAGTDRLSDRTRDAILAIVRATVADTLERGDEEDSEEAPSNERSLGWAKDAAPSRRTATRPATDRQG